MRSLRRILFGTAVGLFLFWGTGVSPLKTADAQAHAGVAYVPGRLLVGHRKGIDLAVIDRAVKLQDTVIRRQRLELGFSVLEVPEASSEIVMASLMRTGLFTYVERDYYAQLGGDAAARALHTVMHAGAGAAVVEL